MINRRDWRYETRGAGLENRGEMRRDRPSAPRFALFRVGWLRGSLRSPQRRWRVGRRPGRRLERSISGERGNGLAQDRPPAVFVGGRSRGGGVEPGRVRGGLLPEADGWAERFEGQGRFLVD